MNTIFVMGGLAEAAVSLTFLIVSTLLILSAAITGLGWWKRSVGLAGLGCSICLIAGILLQPWNCFRGPEVPNDPDETYWLVWERIASVIWVAAFGIEYFTLRGFSATMTWSCKNVRLNLDGQIANSTSRRMPSAFF